MGLFDRHDPLKNAPNVGRLTASPAQVNKLLVMLSTDGYIKGTYNRDDRQWEYDTDAAIEWLADTMGFEVTELGELTHKQIGRCYDELEGK